MMLGYYGFRRTGQDKYFNNMLWMIAERPADDICDCLGHEYHSRALTWTQRRIDEASSLWKRQIKMHRHDARVLCNAASFFRWHDRALSEQLYRRAKHLEPKFGLPCRELAYHYRFLATKAPKRDQPRLIRLAILEADESLNRRDHYGERSGVLVEFTPTAIKFGHLKHARKFAKRLQYRGQSFYLWSQYAYLFLSWIDFKENRKRGFKFKLNKLRQSFSQHPTHVAACSAALSFVNDAVKAGDVGLQKKF